MGINVTRKLPMSLQCLALCQWSPCRIRPMKKRSSCSGKLPMRPMESSHCTRSVKDKQFYNGAVPIVWCTDIIQVSVHMSYWNPIQQPFYTTTAAVTSRGSMANMILKSTNRDMHIPGTFGSREAAASACAAMANNISHSVLVVQMKTLCLTVWSRALQIWCWFHVPNLAFQLGWPSSSFLLYCNCSRNTCICLPVRSQKRLNLKPEMEKLNKIGMNEEGRSK